MNSSYYADELLIFPHISCKRGLGTPALQKKEQCQSNDKCLDFEKQMQQIFFLLNPSKCLQIESVWLPPQHYILAFGGIIAVPLILAEPLCIKDNNVAKSQLISTIFFVSGLCTILQTALGTR